MENTQTEVKKLIGQFDVNTGQINPKYVQQVKEQEDKKLKKKIKKWNIEPEDNNQTSLEKTEKLLDEFYKQFQITAKQNGKIKQLDKVVKQNQIQTEKAMQQKKMIENLHSGFKQKYYDEVKRAEDIEKEEQTKRKKVIEQLQDRIKTIQGDYEEAGKQKIQKFKENETLKHQLSKLEPHLIASQSLYDAQLKKKSIQIEIQMTTLKQKIQMMNSFKNMSAETQEKLIKAKQNAEKIQHRVNVLEGKQDEHKMLMAKAHLVFEDYKKALNTLKDVLPKKQRQAALNEQNVKKKRQALAQMEGKLKNLDENYEKEVNSLNVLKSLEENLRKQLA